MKPITRSQNSSLLRIVLALAWPTMLEQLMQTLVQYIDTAMVGTLGTNATAAVGATTSVNWLVSSTVSAIGTGFLSVIARACGAGDRKEARRASAQTVLAVLVSGAFFTVLTLSLSGLVPKWMQVDPAICDLASTYFLILYSPMLFRAATIIFGTTLRAAGDTKTPMKVGIMVNLINVVLNTLFIFPTHEVTLLSLTFTLPGTGWGVAGAAIASAIAFAVGGLYMTIVFLRHPFISPKGESLRPDRAILTRAARVAVPNMLQRMGTCLGYVTFASMINSLGGVPTAAHTISNTVESAFYIPAYGMQTAAATLAGNAWGAGDRARIKELGRIMTWAELALMCVTGGLLFALAPGLVSIFTKDAAVIDLASAVLRMVAFSEPFYGVFIVTEGMMLGMGEAKKPFLFNIAGMWGIRILGTFICTQLLGLGLISAWACMIGHNLTLFAIYVFEKRSGRWLPKS